VIVGGARFRLADLSLARDPKIGRGPLGREEEGQNIRHPVLDRPEIRAVAPALADVERGLAEVARGWIDLPEVGEMVHPALLGAGADIEIDPLNGAQRPDRVLAAFQDVVNGFLAPAFLPALTRLVRFAPARAFLGAARAGGRLVPANHVLVGESGPLRGVDQRVHGAGVVDLVGGNRAGVRGAGAGMGEHLPFQAGLGHAGDQQFGDAQVLVADQSADVFPFRMLGIGRRVERVEGDVAGAAGGADAERRLDGGVGEMAGIGIGAFGIIG